MDQKKQKSSREGSVMTSDMQAGSFLGRGDLIRALYAGAEVQGGCDRVRRGGAGLG